MLGVLQPLPKASRRDTGRTLTSEMFLPPHQHAQKYVLDGPCLTAFMEPGFEGIFMDDEKIFPIYEFCEKNQIPLMISFGGFHGPTAEYCNALHADAVAKTFPYFIKE